MVSDKMEKLMVLCKVSKYLADRWKQFKGEICLFIKANEDTLACEMQVFF